MKKTTLPLFLLLALAALALVGCGGGDTASSASSAASSAAESVIGGGSATCDQATFDAWVKTFGEQADVNGATLGKDAFKCADGWAVLMPTVGTNDPNSAYDENVIVQAEGPNWALMDREKACADAQENSDVPAALYELACKTD